MSECTRESTVFRKEIEGDSGLHPNKVLKDYLLKRAPVFRELCELKDKVWWSQTVSVYDLLIRLRDGQVPKATYILSSDTK